MSGMSNKLTALMLITLLSMVGVNVAHAVGGNSTGGEWEYSLAPLFLWAQGIEGTSQVGPTTSPLTSLLIAYASDLFEKSRGWRIGVKDCAYHWRGAWGV